MIGDIAGGILLALFVVYVALPLAVAAVLYPIVLLVRLFAPTKRRPMAQ